MPDEEGRAVVRIRLFGEVGATDDSGAPLDVGPAKCRAVLAVLALSPRSAIPVSRIADAVWGEASPRTADKTLQSYVTRLRKGLGEASIVRAGAAYRLDLPDEAIDVVRFRRHLDGGDAEAALEEWTGTPLVGLELTAEHPFREGLWALLMTALYRLGRQADALAAFHRVRAHLVGELGVDPGRRLRQLEAHILDQSPSLDEKQTSTS